MENAKCRNYSFLTKASLRRQYIHEWHSTVRAQLRCFINKSIIADTIYTGMIHWWQNHLSISNNTEMTHYWCHNHTWKWKVLDLHIMLKSCLKTKITDLQTFEKSHCRNDQNAGFTHFFSLYIILKWWNSRYAYFRQNHFHFTISYA